MCFARAFEMKLALAVVAGEASLDGGLRRPANGDSAAAIAAGRNLGERARRSHVLQIDPVQLIALHEQIGDCHMLDFIKRDADGQIGVAGIVLIGQPPFLDAKVNLAVEKRPFERLKRRQAAKSRSGIAADGGSAIEE